jgi:hypothetical protein
MTVPNLDGFPVTTDVTIPQGSIWSQTWHWATTDDGGVTTTDVDVHTYKARMQIRDRAQSATLYATLSSDDTETPDGTITLTADGHITAAFDGSHGAADDAPLFEGVRKGVYDLFIWTTPGDDTTRFMFAQGAVVIAQMVTDSVATP